MTRVVSLIASSTEIVCALGLQESLVGRSHECDHPPDIGTLPVCTEPKFLDGTSYEIDQRVKAILQEGLSVYRVDADLLADLRPDVILTQTQCEVCAVSESDVEAAVCDWLERRPRIVSLHPDSFDDVWDDVVTVARALGVADRGEDLVRRSRQRTEEIARRARSLDDRPRVACIEWIDPLMAAGNWMPELVEMAGGDNQFGEAGEHAPWMTFQELVANDPDVIVVLPCGFDLERTRQEMTALAGRPGWDELRAVEENRVFLADGNQYFNRPGPRIVEALEIMAEMLHPETFDFDHHHSGWEGYP